MNINLTGILTDFEHHVFFFSFFKSLNFKEQKFAGIFYVSDSMKLCNHEVSKACLSKIHLSRSAHKNMQNKECSSVKITSLLK